MNMPVSPRRVRGVMLARSEGDAVKLFEDLKRTVEAFKAEHTAELDGIKKKYADVVQTEKVDRINTEISALQASLDQINAILAAQKLGGGNQDESDPAVREHKAAFNKWFRTGEGEQAQADLAVKAMLTTQSKPDGGYLTPTTMESTIDRVLGTVSALRGLANVMPIGGPKYTKLMNMGGAGARWAGEEEASTETATPKLRELEFTVMKLEAEPYATQETLDDGIIDIEQWLADEVAVSFAEAEGAAFISGSGVKKPRGLLSYDTVANANYEWGKIGYVASGASADFATSAPADALVGLYYALKSGYRANASWLSSDPVMEKIRKMKDGQGNYLWAGPASPGELPTILGKPVSTDDNMPAVGANAFPVAFGDFKRAYLVIDRKGITVLRNPYKVHGKVAFFTTKRVGGGVANFEAVKLLKIASS